MIKFCAFLTVFVGSLAFGAPCSSGNQANDTCDVQIADLRPAQFSVGMREVEERASKFSAMSNKKLLKYLNANPAEIVIGPGGTFYCVDRNHLALALQSIGVTSMPAQVAANLSSDVPTTFWQTMQDKHWLYLYDGAAGPLPYSQLPAEVSGLHDDPYRSLAWSVRKAGGYKKTDAFFADFLWANFFRGQVDVGTTDVEYNQAVTVAIPLAESAAAKSLPGWTGP